MLELTDEKEICAVGGGDRWGDGRDYANHPNPAIGVTICSPMPSILGDWDACISVRQR